MDQRRPGEDTSTTFTLPTHVKDNLTPDESAQAFVSYFSKISKEYTPLDGRFYVKGPRKNVNIEKWILLMK